LIELEGTESPNRLKRVVRASLRDPNQFAEVRPHLQRMILDARLRPVVLDACGSYFDGETDRSIVCSLGRMLSEAGYLNVRNLAGQLVAKGLSASGDHEEVLGYLKRMLEDPDLVTSTRRSLSDGLRVNNRDVAWGSVRCLWETGSKSDPRLADALATIGLRNLSHKENARAWLLELLDHPRMARVARRALEQAAYSALYPLRGNPRDYDLAWSIADCLLAADVLHAEHLTEALVVGALHSRENHPESVATLGRLLTRGGELANGITDELWKALNDTNSAVQWGAACVLIDMEGVSRDLVEVVNDEGVDDEDQDDQDEHFKDLSRLWRVLIREAPSQPQASEWLSKLTYPSHVGVRRRRTLIELVKDKDSSVAYAAARYLLGIGEARLSELAAALVAHGLTDDERRDEAARFLDGLRAEPSTALWAKEALNRALWGSDMDAAWAAAKYALARGERTNPGIPRAIVFGGLLNWHWKEAEGLMRPLIGEADTHTAAVDALTAGVYSEDEGRFRIARLLVEFGAPITDRLVTVMSEMARWQPWVPLALVAITGRVDEAREAANQTGLREFSDILGVELVAGD
jgi:HEAT repeat protein